jgi:hypothetical protein
MNESTTDNRRDMRALYFVSLLAIVVSIVATIVVYVRSGTFDGGPLAGILVVLALIAVARYSLQGSQRR